MKYRIKYSSYSEQQTYKILNKRMLKYKNEPINIKKKVVQNISGRRYKRNILNYNELVKQGPICCGDLWFLFSCKYDKNTYV